jgi:trk system potassium uptake protein
VFQRKYAFLTPGRLILFSLLAACGCGTLLLMLPCAQLLPVKLSDALFTAISATSVTGLLTVPLDSFTLFGQIVILALIQIGGLGLITLSIFLISFFLELGLGTQLLAGQLYELESWRGARRLITFIVGITAILELAGTLALLYILPAEYTGLHRVFYALFHAVSSFCNAGFVIFPSGIASFKSNISFLLITLILVAVGGFGFISLHEIIRRFARTGENKRRHVHISLHTQVTIITTVLITLLTSLTLWVLEYQHTFAHQPFFTTLINVVFDALCARSAGFTTLDTASIRLPTLFIIMIVSFIGSSPGSTGSGIKTTTFAIFIATIRAVISGRLAVSLKGRRIPNDQVFKAMAVFSLSLTWISIILFALLLTEEGWHFIDIMFETFSAFANLGLSTGITPYLSIEGKWSVMLMMIIGRIGSLTLLIALKRRQDGIDVRYPEERLILS